MSWRNNSDRYGSVSIGLHWLMFLLLVAVYACIELRDVFPKGSDLRATLKTWHFMLGLSVFILAALRLLARFASGPAPRIDPPLPRWQQLTANTVHWALYGLMLGLPLAGWLILSASGQVIPFFGWELPALIAENRPFARWIKDVHETVGNVGYFLIGFHAAAALFHHYIVRDNTLWLMLPCRTGTRQSAQGGSPGSGGPLA